MEDNMQTKGTDKKLCISCHGRRALRTYRASMRPDRLERLCAACQRNLCNRLQALLLRSVGPEERSSQERSAA